MTNNVPDGGAAVDDQAPSLPNVREAHDATEHTVLKDDPSHEDAKLEIALDESFPTSDAPGHSSGNGEPAPSSGFDEAAELQILKRRERAYAQWESEGRPEGRHLDHWQQTEAPEPGTDPWVEGP